MSRAARAGGDDDIWGIIVEIMADGTKTTGVISIVEVEGDLVRGSETRGAIGHTWSFYCL